MRKTVRTASFALVVTTMLIGLLIQKGGRADTAGTALQFNGANQYVTFGAAPGLGAATFTLETWFKRTGAGVGTSTGSGGVASAIPLVTKGRAEAEGSNVDMNYFLGIDATSGRLVADFEEGPSTGGTLGLNHPVSGTTVITSNVWHHAAATYDGQTWKLYLDGVLDGSLTLAAPRPPRSDSIQHAGLATAMTSLGAAAGFFQGALDEARIWNVARTQAQIQATKDSEITGPIANLIGRWGMNEGTGSSLADSSGSGANGTAVGTPTWVAGFPIPDTTPPAAPQNLTANAGNALVTLTWNANTESDLAGYNVYRSTESPVPTDVVPVNGGTLILGNVFTDTGLTNLAPYYYVVEAVDASANASAASNEATATPDPNAGAALSFDGTNDYVTFGPTSRLGSPTFTLETWFKRTGAGVGTNTGSGGIASAIPLVTKGRAEAEGSSVDMNYFLGIDATSGTLVADFEDMATGGNHPVSGTTAVTSNVWHHAAATYDGSKWQLFLDGVLDAELIAGQTPRSDSIQHAGLATAMNSTGVAAGFFQGILDEARIWNYARTQAEIQGTLNLEVPSANGLIGRWGMNEGTGTSVSDSSSAPPINGTATGGPGWVAGHPFGQNQAPVVNAGSDQTITLPASASLSGTVTDDGLPNPPAATTAAWSKVSGSGTVTFGTPNAAITTASFSTSGTYVLRLTAGDGLLQASDDVTVTVNPAPVNQAPTVNAGPDQTITLPAGASLSGTVADDGLPGSGIASTWSKFSGPGTVSFADASATSTTATFSVAGGYVLRLTASDGALSSSDDVAITVNPAPGNYAIDFGGTNAYVTLGPAPGLGLTTFTIETKFRRDGAGIGTNTGTGGIASAIPLLTKGRAEAEGSSVDMNYFVGIDATTGKLVADFEDMATGANHPVVGTTAVTSNVWHHAAATYDGQTWKLYLDGAEDATLTLPSATPPRSDSIQHAALATAVNSTGLAAGFFDGVLDEARIWDHARTQAEIRADANQELSSGTGLVARWGLNEGVGTAVADSTDTPVDGSIIGSNWSWTAGAPPVNLRPLVDAGSDQTIVLPAEASLTGTVTDDGLPGPGVTSTWSKFSGPGTVTFANPNSTNTTASFSISGSYVLTLTGSDGSLQGTDQLTVTVNPAPVNQPPVVNAGSDQTITLPAGASLSGTVTDDGLPGSGVTSTWSKSSGPGTVSFADPSAASTTATFSAAGGYVLRLTASDGALSSSDDVAITVSPAAGNYAIDFGGTNAYVTFGPAPALGVPTFTIETKFRRDGAGVATSTGTGGVTAVPLVTKGRAEAENSNVDMNFFLGIDGSTNRLAADFEEGNTGVSGNTPGLNHPVLGVTAIQNNVWYHAAATYDGTTWRLYLNGTLEAQLTVGQPPRSDSIQHAALATAMNSTGVAAGFFDGVLDEARIWDHARTQAEIRADANQELSSGTGLVARWGLNEGVGTGVGDSTANPINGTVVGSNWSWTDGAPAVNLAPLVDAGPDQTIGLPAGATLSGTASDDGLPNPPGVTTTTWSTVSGPGTVTFADPNAASTTADFSSTGVYVLSLTANDGALSSSDQVTVTVTGNQAPVVSAGPDQAITLPAQALLSGSATDDGLPNPPTLTTAWTKISGPGVVTFGESTSPTTSASFSVAGIYVLRLTASDGALTSYDEATITVNPTGSPTNQAIDFGGTNAYVTFGNPAKLHLPTFTVEAWFNRQGTGVTATTGTNGIANALPLVTRGTGEAENPAVDMNYFLGIDAATNVLAADFEEGAGGTSPSLNHPIRGVTPITNNAWHHAAATYDGSKWQLFLDGVLERELTVGQPPAAAGNQYAALGTALTSTGVAASFFDGVIDEARVWDRPLTASEIRTNMNVEVASAAGLVARWGLNEGTGTSVGDSTAAPAVGTVTGTNWAWAAGAPFNVNHAPDAPSLIAPAGGATDVATSPSLDLSVSDLDGNDLTVTYYGRPKSGSPPAGPDFTLIALPDTQFYVSSLNGGTPEIFNAQTQWIVDNTAARNIVFVTQLGDCVQNGDNAGNPVEWVNANTAMSRLDDPQAPPVTGWGIPFGVAVGNHDQSPIGSPTGTTTFYNQYFGESRFSGRTYYGGHYGTNNDNHYELFSASGLDFIVVHLEYDPAANPAVLAWANGLLQTYADRRAIVVSHYIINAGNPATFGAQGQAIYNALKGNPNLFLMLCGHVSPPEGQRQDTFDGHTVTTLMSDYQGRAHGGDGWLRIMEFSPANNQIRVRTYSPTLNQFETDADSQFTLDYDMQGSPAAPWTVVGTNVAPSGSTTSTTWNGLSASTEYEWYVTVTDGQATTTGPTWTFTTAGAPANRAPIATAQTVTTAEDIAKAITLTASDPDGDPLTFSIASQPSNGTLTGTAPNVTYTPAANYHGPDSFTFKANDGSLDSTPATVSITVTSVNDPPVANTASLTTAEDTAKPITLTGSDADGDTLTFSVVGSPAHGALSGAAPNVTYTPAANYNGPDSFTFKANDGTIDSATATVSITVTPVNDPPVAGGSSVTTAEDTAKPITLTASDPDGDTLTFTIVTAPIHGTLTGTAPNVTYTPAANYNGSDSFTFKASDGVVASSEATVSITITPVNDPPVANPASVTTAEGTAKAITLTASDPEGDALTFIIVNQPGHGTLSGSTPNVTYTPAANYSGPDSFTFKANDGTLDSSAATVSITITPVNHPPVANSASATTAEDTPRPITLTASDSDGNPLTFSIVTSPAHGALSGAAPNVTYTPAANYNGADNFTFKANDGTADSNVATVSITVTPVNDPPVASSASMTTAEDTANTITLTASDPDGPNSLTFIIAAPPAHGALSGTAPNVTYTPAANYNGLDGFTFKVNDGLADSNVATVSITVTPVNDPPVAIPVSATTAEDTTATITLTASDLDGSPLTLSIVSPPAHGALSGTAPNVTYTPAANYNGPDGFTFKANDGSFDSNVAMVSITVTPVNDAPVAANSAYTTIRNQPVTGTLTATDIDSATLTYRVVALPRKGTVQVTSSGTFTYTPNSNANGSDSFTFKANDGALDSNIATVTIKLSRK